MVPPTQNAVKTARETVLQEGNAVVMNADSRQGDEAGRKNVAREETGASLTAPNGAARGYMNSTSCLLAGVAVVALGAFAAPAQAYAQPLPENASSGVSQTTPQPQEISPSQNDAGGP